ncbi:unnamed protein product [Vitrella brassicaformis CCMP3155]|uniref:DNA endonuclease activator Ctp1 C-terminal domain-containing protein n=1 Tax=Vitrella brassicaformis (strain CCMP3155) TaxID=1169540 RepID=A0A0G4GJ55_VITBC|nr:unnamed protein product [Vitrella brassicaformis CCMP3155]|eukprot:CEM29788.1 unnamed protein product [Vitrella brassicaformis CCMP3155]
MAADEQLREENQSLRQQVQRQAAKLQRYERVIAQQAATITSYREAFQHLQTARAIQRSGQRAIAPPPSDAQPALALSNGPPNPRPHPSPNVTAQEQQQDGNGGNDDISPDGVAAAAVCSKRHKTSDSQKREVHSAQPRDDYVDAPGSGDRNGEPAERADQPDQSGDGASGCGNGMINSLSQPIVIDESQEAAEKPEEGGGGSSGGGDKDKDHGREESMMAGGGKRPDEEMHATPPEGTPPDAAQPMAVDRHTPTPATPQDGHDGPIPPPAFNINRSSHDHRRDGRHLILSPRRSNSRYRYGRAPALLPDPGEPTDGRRKRKVIYLNQHGSLRQSPSPARAAALPDADRGEEEGEGHSGGDGAGGRSGSGSGDGAVGGGGEAAGGDGVGGRLHVTKLANGGIQIRARGRDALAGLAAKRANAPNYRAVVRNREERADNMEGYECSQCAGFYRALGMDPPADVVCNHSHHHQQQQQGSGGSGASDRAASRAARAANMLMPLPVPAGRGQQIAQAIVKKTSKHRFYRPPAATPEGFWAIDFPPTPPESPASQ